MGTRPRGHFAGPRRRAARLATVLAPASNWTIAGPPIAELLGSKKPWVVSFDTLTPGVTGDTIAEGTIEGYGRAIVGEGLVFAALPLTALGKKNSPKADNADIVDRPAFTPENGALITSVAVSKGSKTVRLDTVSLRRLAELMARCSGDIVRVWGLDPQVQANLKSPVIVENFVGIAKTMQEGYPVAAASRGEQARIFVRVMVNAAGKATACQIGAKTKADHFGTSACDAVMKVARFSPAIDAEGTPVASYWIQQIRYSMSPN